MYVCICKGITDTQIRAAVEDGASSLREVRNTLGVASQCGKCNIMTRAIVRATLLDSNDETATLLRGQLVSCPVYRRISEPTECATTRRVS